MEPGAVIGLMIGMALLCAVGYALLFQRHERGVRPVLLRSIRGGRHILPFSQSIAVAHVPVSFHYRWNERGELSVWKPDTRGVSAQFSAGLLPVESAEDDPSFRMIESWAQEHGTTVEFAGDRCIAHAERVVEREADDYHIHEWYLGGHGVVVSCVAEIQGRLARPAPAQRMIREISEILRNIHIKLHREVITLNSGPMHLAQIDGEAVPLLRIEPRDEQRLEKWCQEAKSLQSRYFSESITGAITPQLLDATLFMWQRDTSPNRPEDEVMIHSLGAALGRHLQERTGMKWVACHTEHVRQLVLHDPATGVVASPFRMIVDHASFGLPNPCEVCATAVSGTIAQRQRSGQSI